MTMADKETKDIKEVFGNITGGLSKLGGGVVDLAVIGVSKAQEKITSMQKNKKEKADQDKPKKSDKKKDEKKKED